MVKDKDKKHPPMMGSKKPSMTVSVAITKTKPKKKY